MTDRQKRKSRCCFTGHRPEKFLRSEEEIIAGLGREIDAAIADSYRAFITGMSRGTDIWAAELVLRRRDEGADVKLICAVPYPGFERAWSADWQARYNRILERADAVRVISPEYSRGCFHVRNRWMVDRSARLIAAHDGSRGGTEYTVDYALAGGLEVRFV